MIRFPVLRRLALACALLLLAAACGGGDDDAAAVTTTTLRQATLLTTSTVPATSLPPSTTSTTTTIATDEPDIWPLTGAPRADDVGPYFVAKIDNSVFARPHAGLEDADLVIEVLVEGGIARMLAFFQSAYPERVLPVRSLREVDPKLLEPFAPVVASTGGQFAVVSSIRAIGHDVSLDVLGDDAYSQEPGRRGLYAWTVDTQAALDAVEAEAPATTFFRFGSTEGDERAQQVDLAMSPVHRVVYRYSQVDGGYLRFHGDEPHETVGGAQIVATNVLALFVDEISTGRVDSSGAPVPDYDVVGSGDLVLFQDGRAIEGRWERGRTSDWFRLFTVDGNEIELRSGSTWIQLVPVGRALEWS